MPDGSVPVVLSADTEALLCREAAALLSFVQDHRAVGPDRIADMLFRTRVVRRYRALVMATDRDCLLGALPAIVDRREHSAVVRNEFAATTHRRAFVLPGQGGQRPGMGQDFYASAPAYRTEIDRCDEAFGRLFGASPLSYLLSDTLVEDSTTLVQSALFMHMVGLGAMWRAAGIEPDVMVGHSQGEIAAAYLAHTMTLDDAVLIVGTRSRAVETISSDDYAMAVVAASRDECEAVLACQSGWAQVSVINSPRMVGISGDRDTVQIAVDTLTLDGRFARIIPVRYPAHTSLLNQFRAVIQDAVQSRLQHNHFLDSDVECIGATLGDLVSRDISLGDYWFWNLRNTVRFDRAVAAAIKGGADTFVELAEHPTLQFAVQENIDALASGPAMVVGTSSRTAVGLREFTTNLALLAVNQADYPWQRLLVDSANPAELPLLNFPTTCMNELTLWLPYHGHEGARVGQPAKAAEQLPRTSPQAPTPQIVVEEWVRLTRRSMMAPQTIGIIDHTGGCAALVHALCAEAQNQGLSARLLDVTVDGASGGDDVDTVVVLLPESSPMSQSEATESISEFFVDRQWWLKPNGTLKRYWLLTVEGEMVVPGDIPPHPVHAAIAAGFRCVGGEQPDIAFGHLDVSAPQLPDLAPKIIAALHIDGEPELALREGSVYAKRLIEAPRPAAGLPIEGRHVLITGGTGSLGLELCEHVARAGARQITLVSRSGETQHVSERLRGIRHSGNAEIRVLSCDVGNASAVQQLAQQLQDCPVGLLVHAVMDTPSAAHIELAEISGGMVRAALHGKVAGIANVMDSVALEDDCRIVLFSSVASVLGGRGKIVYAAANRLLDAYAQRQRAQGSNCVSVQWGQWAVFRGVDDADIATLSAVGYLPMASADAIAFGLGDLPGDAAVVAFDWDRVRAALGDLGYGRLLSELNNSVAVEHDSQVVPEPVAAAAGSVRLTLVRLLGEVIGSQDLAALDTTVPLVAVGVDSLHALQLRRRIKSEFGCEVAVSELLGGATLDDVVRMVESGTQQPFVSPSPASGRVAQKADNAVPGDFDLGNFEIGKIHSARSDLDLFGLHAMWQVLEPVLEDGGVRSVDEIAQRLRFVDRHLWVLRQWLPELVKHGCLEGNTVSGYRYVQPLPLPVRSGLSEVCSDLGYLPAFAEFLAAANANLADLVQDQVSVQELLFPDGSTETADAFYRDNVISRYLNLAARDAVADAVRRLQRDRSPVRILELGAGVGGMTHDIVAGLAGLSVEYQFTDMSTFFINEARKSFADHPWMRFGLVDLNADLKNQPSQDIVVASNVVHNAHDVPRTLAEIHGLLRPGGAVVFIEVCQAHCQFMTSVYFLMSPRDGQPQVGLTDARAGTDRIFLTRAEWQGALSQCGFRPATTLPSADDPLSLLDHHVFVAVRDTETAGDAL